MRRETLLTAFFALVTALACTTDSSQPEPPDLPASTATPVIESTPPPVLQPSTVQQDPDTRDDLIALTPEGAPFITADFLYEAIGAGIDVVMEEGPERHYAFGCTGGFKAPLVEFVANPNDGPHSVYVLAYPDSLTVGEDWSVHEDGSAELRTGDGCFANDWLAPRLGNAWARENLVIAFPLESSYGATEAALLEILHAIPIDIGEGRTPHIGPKIEYPDPETLGAIPKP